MGITSERHVSWSEDACGAASRLSQLGLALQTRSLQSRHAPLALAPRMIVSREPFCASSVRYTARTRRCCTRTALRARIRTIRPYGDTLPHGWIHVAWIYGCLFACVYFISRAIQVPTTVQYPSGPLHDSPGDRRIPAQPLSLRLDRTTYSTVPNGPEQQNRAVILPTSRSQTLHVSAAEGLLALLVQ